MATYHSYRSTAVQKRVLLEGIKMLQSTAMRNEQVDVQSRTVLQLHDYFNELLLDADLGETDLNRIIEELIAASHNTQGTISASRAKLLQQTATILVGCVKQDLANNEAAAAWRTLSAFLFHFDQAYWRLRRNLPDFRPLTEALELMVALACNENAAQLQDEIFDFCHRCYLESPVVNKTTLKAEWLFVMAHVVQDERQETLVTELCSTFKSPYSGDPEVMELIGDESLQVMRLMYSRIKTRPVLKEFLHAHLQDDFCRKKAIAMAAEDNDHAMAIELCYERIKAGRQDDRKLYDWYRLMLDNARKINDAQHVLLAAEWLFKAFEDFQYYQLIRQFTDPYQWQQQWFSLIEYLRVRKNASTLLQIFVEEKEYGHMDQVLKELGIYEWFRFEKLLMEKCPHILEKHFDIPVWNWLKWKSPGITEQEIVDYLKRMRARFGDHRMMPVIQLIKAMYPRRLSFHEALDHALG